MKCPYCGSEMKEGYVFSYKDGAISFGTEVPGLFAKNDKAEGYINLGEFKLGSKSTVKANACEVCKKIVIDY